MFLSISLRQYWLSSLLASCLSVLVLPLLLLFILLSLIQNRNANKLYSTTLLLFYAYNNLTIISLTMEHHSSSDQIIYMSPHNPKFPHKPAKTLLFDQPLLLSFEGAGRDAAMVTPEKQQGESSARRVLNQSSTDKPIRLQFAGEKNPFGEFEDEKDAGLLIREERVKEEEASRKKGDTIKKEARSVNALEYFLVNPKKEDLTPKQSQHQLERSIAMQYEVMLAMIKNNEYVKSPQPFFFKNWHRLALSKLICFDLNRKNGKRVKYNAKTMTCQPTFRCLGCWKEYSVASALGGHLSKCEKKEQHLYRVKLDESLYSLYSSEEEEERGLVEGSREGSEKARSRQARRNSTRRASRRMRVPTQRNLVFAERFVPDDLSLSELLRPRRARAAKTRAEELIKSAIQTHFE